VANAHREDGVSVSDAEQAVIDEISTALEGAGRREIDGWFGPASSSAPARSR